MDDYYNAIAVMFARWFDTRVTSNLILMDKEKGNKYPISYVLETSHIRLLKLNQKTVLIKISNK